MASAILTGRRQTEGVIDRLPYSVGERRRFPRQYPDWPGHPPPRSVPGEHDGPRSDENSNLLSGRLIQGLKTRMFHSIASLGAAVPQARVRAHLKIFHPQRQRPLHAQEQCTVLRDVVGRLADAAVQPFDHSAIRPENQDPDARRPRVAPGRAVNVDARSSKTAGRPRRGGDGGFQNPDCLPDGLESLVGLRSAGS